GCQFCSCCRDRRHLPSFPTRRSSDLAKSPEKYWARMAAELRWMKPWKKVLEWKAPFAKWFVGGKLNVSDNCLDRHLSTWRRNKRSEEHTSELQSRGHLVCRLLLEKKN